MTGSMARVEPAESSEVSAPAPRLSSAVCDGVEGCAGDAAALPIALPHCPEAQAASALARSTRSTGPARWAGAGARAAPGRTRAQALRARLRWLAGVPDYLHDPHDPPTARGGSVRLASGRAANGDPALTRRHLQYFARSCALALGAGALLRAAGRAGGNELADRLTPWVVWLNAARGVLLVHKEPIEIALGVRERTSARAPRARRGAAPPRSTRGAAVGVLCAMAAMVCVALSDVVWTAATEIDQGGGARAYGAPATAADAVRVLASCVLCRAWALAEGLRPVVPIFPAIAFLIPLWMYAKIALALGMAGAEAETVRRRAVGVVIHGAAPLYALLFIHGDATRLRAEQPSCVPIDLAVVSLSLLVLGQVKNTITFGDFLATRVALVSVLGEAYVGDPFFWSMLVSSVALTHAYYRSARQVDAAQRQERDAVNARVSRAMTFLSHETRNLLEPAMHLVEEASFDNRADRKAAFAALSSINAILDNVKALSGLMAPSFQNPMALDTISGAREVEQVAFPTAASRLADLVSDVASVGRCIVGCRPAVSFASVVRVTSSGAWDVCSSSIGKENAGESKRARLARLQAAQDEWLLGECYVRASHTALVQVITNLVTNANKFTEEGSIRMEWRLEHVHIHGDDGGNEGLGAADRKGGHVRVSVAVVDSGCGMSVVEADNVLEDFGATRTGFSQEQGTGLGLPLCRRIVEGIGGTLVLESVEGAGTTATVNLLLPVCEAPRCCEESGLDSCSRALKRMLVAAGSPGVTADVLVADDSALCRMVYERVLGRLGLRYECVPDGEDVVRRIRGGATYGLLLLDEEMAHMCGSTACDEVRTIGYTGAAVLVTANELSAPERDRLTGESGLDAVFVKGQVRGSWQDLLKRWTVSSDTGSEKRRSDDGRRTPWRHLSR